MIGLRDAKIMLSDLSALANANQEVQIWIESMKQQIETLESEFLEIVDQLTDLKDMVSTCIGRIWETKTD